MANRSIFNRRYTPFDSAGQEVFLVNGAGVVTQLSSTTDFTAGETLVQGAVVYVSGTQVFNATALSGVAAFNYGAIGITAASGSPSQSVSVVLDDAVVIANENITADTALIPGDIYYLSKFSGQITRFQTASGQVTNSGTDQYQVSLPIGRALSTSELEVEIGTPTILYE
jgi:hypothetical protein